MKNKVCLLYTVCIWFIYYVYILQNTNLLEKQFGKDTFMKSYDPMVLSLCLMENTQYYRK